ncbi:MAG: UDP-N-acetylmuramate dehydrogenase [Bacteroidota bacterium]
MHIQKDASLKEYNTFGIDVKAKQYIAVNSDDELIHILKRFYASELFFLSGGSNILLTKDLDATVLHIQTKGIKILEESEKTALVEAQAGENWHQFVQWCIQHDLGGLENLSLIPGCVGTSPIQNIGAYGVELKDHFYACDAINIQTLEKKTFSKKDCKFGYRNSIFKNELKGLYLITSVRFLLTKKKHQLHTEYGAIQTQLEKNKVKNPTIEDVANAVVQIRKSKLPNPIEIGNSGSFFKNPVVDFSFFQHFISQHKNAPYYKINENEYKIPAGWLIEQCGFKGIKKGDAGVHKNQALVLVNYGKASGEEILELAQEIQLAVKEKFQITLEPEVNIVS